MLSSIHPLGERGRHNRWVITVTAFTLAAMASAAAVGAVLGYVGGQLFRVTSAGSAVFVLGIAALLAGTLDLIRVSLPGPKRQVNEYWVGRYRGWVYGGAFGAQLGLGFMTYVVTWTVPVMFLAELVTGSWFSGAAVGAVFGFGRSISLLVAGTIRKPSDLTSFHRHMARLGPHVRRLGAYTVAAAGVVMAIGVIV